MSHKWTPAENELCCRCYLQRYILNKETIPISALAHLLEPELPEISYNSIRLKLLNTRYLCCRAGLQDASVGSSSSHCSFDHEAAFQKILKEFGLSD